VEATSIGNIGVQMIAAKVIKNQSEFRKLVAQSFPVTMYEGENLDAWDGPYRKYLELKKISDQQI